MKRAVLTVFTALLSISAIANTGGVTSVFDIGFGARSQALSGALTSGVNDSAAVYYNPASAFSVERMEIQAGYTPLFFDTTYNFAVAVFPTEDFGSFFSSFAMFTTPGIVFRDDKGQDMGKVSQTLFEGSAGWATQIKEINLDAGVSVKFDGNFMGKYFDSGYGFDIGAIYTPFTGENTLRAALAVKNLVEPSLNMIARNDLSIRQYVAGLSYRRQFGDNLAASVYADIPCFKDGFSAKAGIEAEIYRNYFFRAGWDMSGVYSFGAGAVLFDMMSADYGVFFSDAGINHRVSAKLRIGESIAEFRRSKEAAEMARINKRIAEEMAKKEKELDKKYAGKGDDALRREKYKAKNYISGVEYFRDAKMKEARAAFEIVRGIDENYMNVQRYLAELTAYDKYSNAQYSEAELKLYRQGVQDYMDEKYEQAQKTWEEVLKINKYNIPAREGLRKVEPLLKKIEENK